MLRGRGESCVFHGLECWVYLGGSAYYAPNGQVRVLQAVAGKYTYYPLSLQIQPLAVHL
ncbi:uncharacterized protein METZ01_LOCUS330704, partial [marine metagenome]